MKDTKKKYICADCGEYHDAMSTCYKCGSLRVVLVSMIEPHAREQFGDDWHAKCFPKS